MSKDEKNEATGQEDVTLLTTGRRMPSTTRYRVWSMGWTP